MCFAKVYVVFFLDFLSGRAPTTDKRCQRTATTTSNYQKTKKKKKSPFPKTWGKLDTSLFSEPPRVPFVILGLLSFLFAHALPFFSLSGGRRKISHDGRRSNSRFPIQGRKEEEEIHYLHFQSGAAPPRELETAIPHSFCWFTERLRGERKTTSLFHTLQKKIKNDSWGSKKLWQTFMYNFFEFFPKTFGKSRSNLATPEESGVGWWFIKWKFWLTEGR